MKVKIQKKVLYLLGIILVAVAVLYIIRPKHNVFVKGPDMNVARVHHAATLLNDGRVLITGGWPNISSAEIYDPKTGKFTLIGDMTTPRDYHISVLLKDGRVLIAGGEYGAFANIHELKSAEIFDPATNKFSKIRDMNKERTYLKAVLLQDGRVLIAGGFNFKDKFLSTVEIFDPKTETFTISKNGKLRSIDTATLLNDGKVLLTGWVKDKFKPFIGSEIFDPKTMKFDLAGKLETKHREVISVLLSNGNVLFAGGINKYNNNISKVEIFDPKINQFTRSSDLNIARSRYSVTPLPNGKVLFAGGETGRNITLRTLNSAEIYDPTTGKFSLTDNMHFYRDSHTATLLKDGKVLITGGAERSKYHKTSELYYSNK